MSELRDSAEKASSSGNLGGQMVKVPGANDLPSRKEKLLKGAYNRKVSTRRCDVVDVTTASPQQFRPRRPAGGTRVVLMLEIDGLGTGDDEMNYS